MSLWLPSGVVILSYYKPAGWRHVQGGWAAGCCAAGEMLCAPLAAQVEKARAAVAEAEEVARQLTDAAARARGEVESTRASLRESTPQLFEIDTIITKARPFPSVFQLLQVKHASRRDHAPAV